MPWPYAFVNLSDAEKFHRRELLDWYGGFAQISALVPLSILQLGFLVVWLRTRGRNANQIEAPSSPRAKEARGSAGGWEGRGRRLRWWLAAPVVLGGEVLGSRGEVLGAVGWALWLVVLCFADTGRDYLHLTKRFGIVGASQLPFHYLLALKSPYSPLQFLTGRSHESLNALHQLLGRVITLLLYGHAALYLNFYVQSNLLASKVKEAYVICGILGVWAFTAVGTTALAPVRRWSYRVFYAVHVTLAALLLPLLWFHVSHIRIYIYETAAVYAANAILRSLCSNTVPVRLRLLDSGKLVEVAMLFPPGGEARRKLQGWQPGQHAYLSLPGHPASRTFRSNPFSLASIPTVDNELRFVARVLDGNTAQLAATATSNTAAKHPVTIEGPCGLATHAEKLLAYDRVLFVAGGVGGTFMAPLYRQLLADLSPSAGSLRRQKVSCLWVVRGVEDALWAVPSEEKARTGFVERLQVFVTGSNGSAEHDLRGDEDGIELEERKGLLGSGGGEVKGDLDGDEARVQTHAGRPNVRHIVEQTFSYGFSERVAVVVCGPRGLASELREEIGKQVNMGREVWFWEEAFSM